MALPSIEFIKGQGGLGRALPGQDYISGLLFLNGYIPSDFDSNNRVEAFYSVADAVAAGITDTYSDATAATGTVQVTNKGADGDTLTIEVDELDGTGAVQTTTLCVYTKASTEANTAAVATKVAALINAGQYTHGYTASVNTSTVTITAPKKQGEYLNTGTPIACTIVGTIAVTTTQFSGGVASQMAVMYYHISEFFRIQPKGVLYVGCFDEPTTYDFAEVTLMQQYAAGKIRQVAVYVDKANFATAHMTSLQTILEANAALYQPLSAVYMGDLVSTTDITTLSDLNAYSNELVSACIAQDGAAQGRFLYLTCGVSIGCLGALLGTIAAAKVSESIAWVGKFDLSNGTELETLSFANGTLFSDTTVTESLLSGLNDKRYIFLKKFNGKAGSYWNDSHTAVIASSDYAYIENNRTIDKATRLLYTTYLPDLNSPLQLNADGTLSDNTIAYLESKGDTALDQMIRDAELSAKSVTIDPSQDVLTTSKIVVSVKLLINGVARTIEIPIGFTTSI